MTDYKELIKKIQNKENDYLISLIDEETCFPLSISINKKEDSDYLKTKQIYEELYKNSKANKGYGYTIITNRDERENIRQSTDTRISKIIIENEKDFSSLLKKEKEIENFKENLKTIYSYFEKSQVKDFILKKKKEIFNWDLSFCKSLMMISKFLITNPSSNLYPREIPLPIETKFIENNIDKITGFINYISPLPSAEDKYLRLGLVNPSLMIFIRSGFSINLSIAETTLKTNLISLELPDFKNIEIQKTIYVIENKTTFYTFPLKENEIAIYTGGFSILSLKGIKALKESKILYFGDLDEHGFAILSKFKALYPHVQSFCMDMETLNKFKTFIIKGEYYKGKCFNLNTSEFETLEYITNSNKDFSLRLEQEKITEEYIKRQKETLAN